MYAKVIVGLNQPEMDKLFDYRIPEGMTAEIGVRVIVPFGSRNKKAEGYVISLSEKTEVPADKIKELLEVLDEGRLFLHAEPMPAGNYAARHPHKKQLDSQPKIA